MAIYTYSVSADVTAGAVNKEVLEEEVNEGLRPDCEEVLVNGDVLTVEFSDTLSTGEQTTLDAIILAHQTASSSAAAAVALAAAQAAQSDATQAINDAATAQGTALGASAAAGAAQSDATQGISDAAAAQSTANTAVSNAATAQGAANAAQADATQAIADAATASSAASTAQSAANGAQSTANAASAAAGAAQADATQALSDAATAQSTANTAVSNAAAAQSTADAAVPKPSPAVDNAIVRFDGTTGEVQNSVVTIDDAGIIVSPTGGALIIGDAADPNCLALFADETGRDVCYRQSGNAGSAFVRLEKSLGTLAAKTAITNGTKIGGYSGAGYDGTAFVDGAEVAYVATEDHSPGNHGTELQLRVTPNGNAGAQTVAILQENGDWEFFGKTLHNIADPVLPQDAATKAYIDQLNRSIKITNTDTTSNIAGTALVAFSELMGAIEWNDGDFLANLGGGNVTITKEGRFRVSFGAAWAEFSSNTARNNLAITLWVDGVQVSPAFQSNYMRDGTGHNEVSQYGSVLLEIAQNSVLEIRRQRVSGTGGTMRLQGTNNFFQVERVQ